MQGLNVCHLLLELICRVTGAIVRHGGIMRILPHIPLFTRRQFFLRRRRASRRLRPSTGAQRAAASSGGRREQTCASRRGMGRPRARPE